MYGTDVSRCILLDHLRKEYYFKLPFVGSGMLIT